MDTEIMATSAVKQAIAKTELLKASINEEDKMILWDGEITIYSGAPFSKRTYLDRVPVQVKGRKKTNLSREVVDFPIKKDELIKYRKDGGVLYFLVYVMEDGKTKIYLASLLPYVINDIISSNRDNAIPKVRFQALPENPYRIQRHVIRFAIDRQKQSVVRNRDNYTFLELLELFGRDSIEFDISLDVNKNDEVNIFGGDTFIYARKKGSDIEIPFQRISNIEAVAREVDANITVGDNSFEIRAKEEIDSNGNHKIKIGDSIVILEKDDGNTKLNYNLAGNLDERIKTLEFLVGIVSEDGIKFNNEKIKLPLQGIDLKEYNIEYLKKQLKYFKIIKETLDILGVIEPLDLENMTYKEHEQLRALVCAFYLGQNVTFVEDVELPSVATLKISNLRFLLHFIKVKDKEYRIEDYFNTELRCTVEINNEIIELSRFCILNKEMYLTRDNLNLDKILEDFKKGWSDTADEYALRSSLDMIQAYDERHERVDLLNAAENYNQWRIERDNNDIAAFVNYYQCVVRKRKLTDEEIKDVAEKEITCDDPMAKICLNIILGNDALVEQRIKMLDDEYKEELYKFPIINLYKHDKSEIVQ